MVAILIIIIFYSLIAIIIYFKRNKTGRLPINTEPSPKVIIENNNKILINSAIRKVNVN